MDKKKIKILIIGGTGFIGFHLVKKCLKLNWDVTSFSKNKPKKYRKCTGVKYKIGNLYNKKSLKSIDKKFDYVVNLGGYVNHNSKNENYKMHYVGCKNLYKIFSKKKIKLFLQIGTSLEYGNNKVPNRENSICKPKSIYGKSKLKATKYLIDKFSQNKFPCCILRLYQVFGTHQDENRLIPFVIKSCLLNRSFPCTNGTQYRDFIDIDQLIDLFLKILRSKKGIGEIFNVGSGKLLKIKYLISKINNLIKKGKPEFGKIKMRNNEPCKLYPDIKKINQVFKWKPKYNFNKKIKNLINYEKRNLKICKID